MVKIRKTSRLRNGKVRRKTKKRFDNGLNPPVKMRIDNSNLKHAARQLFDTRLTYSSKKENNDSLKDGTTIEKVEMYFEDFLVNGLKYTPQDYDERCPCLSNTYNSHGKCLTIPGIPPIQYPICIIYNNDDSCLELRWT